MRIRFWGTRGSIATPGPSTLRYGGNTSCVELRSAAGTLVVLDCGTGARALGHSLMEETSDGRTTDGAILLSHTHWDHIQGLPFFEPLFGPNRWHLYGPRGLGASLDQTLAGQMNYQYFPVGIDQLGAEIEYHELVEGTFEIGDLVIRTQYLNHPALTLGYRVEADGAVFCYLADHEPFDSALGAGGDVSTCRDDARHVEFMRGADLVVHDAQYDASEYPARIGWGHSTMQYVVDCACAADVPNTVLYHHDPSHDDATIDDLVARANERAAGRTVVVAAAEGTALDVVPSGDRNAAAVSPPWPAADTPAVDDLSVTVVVLADDAALRDVVETAAREERLNVADTHQSFDSLNDGRIVVVTDIDHAPSASELEELRSAVAPATWARRGVLTVTRTTSGLSGPFPSTTDWLVWPCSTAHVRTKLRAAVLRRACRWVAAPLTGDEESRLVALHALGVLDTEPDPRFDRITDHTREIFGVPIALITLVDRDRQWFKSHRGFDATETPRDQSLCAHAILHRDVMQIPDLLDDPRFADSPAVTTAARIRFYAGAPLTLADGSRVGTLCIADHRPRLLDDAELLTLRRLADEVVVELEK